MRSSPRKSPSRLAVVIAHDLRPIVPYRINIVDYLAGVLCLERFGATMPKADAITAENSGYHRHIILSVIALKRYWRKRNR